MIEPTYVTSEQAKKLKIKGFNEKCEWLYNEQGEPSGTKMGMGGYPNNYNGFYARPEQWMVVEWLKVQHGIWVFPEYQFGRKKWLFNITLLNYFDETLKIQEQYYKDSGEVDYDTTQEAYSAAFDYVLNNLI